MVYTYPGIIHEDLTNNKHNGYWIEFPDLDGCFSDGDTLDELLKNAEEAIELFVLCELEEGRKLPKASSIKDIDCNKDGYTTLVRTDVDLSKNTKSVKKTLTIPGWLNQLALEKNMNFSKVLQEALLEKINA